MRLTGDEAIDGTSGTTVNDFWSWAYSDVLVNTNRSCLAEFLVGAALGITDGIRIEWDAYDLKYQGYPIEVKSSAYVQSWLQSKPSTIKFDIAKKLPWFAESNTFGPEKTRSAFLYVFCLLGEIDKTKANPLNVAQWKFYVIASKRIDEEYGNAKSIGLRGIEALAKPCMFSSLRQMIDAQLPIHEDV